MIYDIINPSDPYTIEGEHAVCCIATAILGEGHYGLQAADGTQAMPLLLFNTAETWFPKTFGKSFADLLHATPPEALAMCLESVLCCSLKERLVYEASDNPAARGVLRLEWSERRSSMNNIGERAYAIAAQLRGEK